MDITHETPLVSLCYEKPEQSVITFLHCKDDKGKEYYGIRGSQLRVIGYELLSIVTNIWRQFPSNTDLPVTGDLLIATS